METSARRLAGVGSLGIVVGGLQAAHGPLQGGAALALLVGGSTAVAALALLVRWAPGTGEECSNAIEEHDVRRRDVGPPVRGLSRRV